MSPAASRIAACVALVSLSGGGCSFVFTRGPSKVASGRYEAGGCTTSRVPPIVDSVIMTAEALGTVSALNRTDEYYASQNVSRGSVVGVGVALTTLFAASAIYGYASVASCRDLNPPQTTPYQHREVKRTRAERQSEEAAEEAAVQERSKAKAAADAAAAGEAARAAQPRPPAAP